MNVDQEASTENVHKSCKGRLPRNDHVDKDRTLTLDTTGLLSLTARLVASAASANKVVQQPKTIFCSQLCSSWGIADGCFFTVREALILTDLWASSWYGSDAFAMQSFPFVSGRSLSCTFPCSPSCPGAAATTTASLNSQHCRTNCWMPVSRSAALASMSFE